MSFAPLSSETVHASCVAIDIDGVWRAVLLAGRSGTGKSDLALRLIDRGARLVSDDYTLVRRNGRALIASAPPTITGQMEVRGIGIVTSPYLAEAQVDLLFDLEEPVARMPPEPQQIRRVAGIDLPVFALAALHASAPIKVEIALARCTAGKGE